MPQYMLLIYKPTDNPPPQSSSQEMAPAWDAYTQSLQDAGVFVARRRTRAARHRDHRP